MSGVPINVAGLAGEVVVDSPVLGSAAIFVGGKPAYSSPATR